MALSDTGGAGRRRCQPSPRTVLPDGAGAMSSHPIGEQGTWTASTVHDPRMEGTKGTATGTRQPALERFPFTKFLPPVLDARVVTERLVARLDMAISQRPLTVLVAPAGSGKTTALAGWAAAARGDVVWIRLGPDDDGPSALATALLEGGRRQLGAGFGTRTAQLLAYAGAAPASRQLVTSLVNDLGEHGPATLVLDDLHEVTGAAARPAVQVGAAWVYGAGTVLAFAMILALADLGRTRDTRTEVDPDGRSRTGKLATGPR
jgi:hypothetical protein